MAQRVIAETHLAEGDAGAARPLLEASCATLREAGETVELAKSEALLRRVADGVSG